MAYQDLRLAYRAIRYGFGLYGTAMAGSLSLVIWHLGSTLTPATLLLAALLGALALITSLPLLVRRITPMWLLHPLTRWRTVGILTWLAAELAALAALARIVAPSLGADAVLWAAALPGLLLALVAVALVPVLAHHNRVQNHTYKFFYIPRRPTVQVFA